MRRSEGKERWRDPKCHNLSSLVSITLTFWGISQFQTNPNESWHLYTLTFWVALQSRRTSGGTISFQRCEALYCLQIHTPCYMDGAKARFRSRKNWVNTRSRPPTWRAIWCTKLVWSMRKHSQVGCLTDPNGTNTDKRSHVMWWSWISTISTGWDGCSKLC